MKTEIKVYIKLVIFKIVHNNLCVLVNGERLPSIPLVNTLNLDLPVKDLFYSSIGSSIDNYYFEQLYTISSENEKITIVYFALVNENDKKNWQKINDIDGKNKDLEIITYALQRLRWKVEYTNVIYSLLPQEFTLSELQKTYESTLDREIDKRNFRKKMLSLNFLQTTSHKKLSGARPAQLYKFRERKPEIIKVFS